MKQKTARRYPDRRFLHSHIPFKPAARSFAVFLHGFFFDMCQLANLPLYNLLFRSVHTYSLLNLFYYSAFL